MGKRKTLIKEVVFKRIQRIRLILSSIWLINRFSVFGYFALNSLDIEIEKILNYDNDYFIKISANNGMNQSNTLCFEKFRGWRGLLIELHPKLFSQLEKIALINQLVLTQHAHHFCLRITQ